MIKWFSIVSHISSFKLSLCNSHMLCTLGNTVRTIYHGKSSSKTNRVSIKKHQLWNNRIGGTSLSHCYSSCCYSLVFELLTLTQYVVTLTTKQHFLFFILWCELVQRDTATTCTYCITAWWKTCISKMSTFQELSKTDVCFFILATVFFLNVPLDFKGVYEPKRLRNFRNP